MKILFIGDISGKVGRRMVKEYLPKFVNKYQIDFVIANGENATHGKGLLRHHYQELIDAGVDCITLGNHYDGKNEIRHYIDRVDSLIRPLNLAHTYPGEGSVVFEVNGVTIRITNLLGTSFMDEVVNNPYFELLDYLSDDDNENATIHIVDFHAEATGEKYCLGYALDGKVSAVLGTHTHVQTNDARIFENGTAFISDVGMTGFYEGCLGVEKTSVIDKLLFGKQSKFQMPEEGKGQLSAVVLDIDELSGKTKEIFPIYFVEE